MKGRLGFLAALLATTAVSAFPQTAQTSQQGEESSARTAKPPRPATVLVTRGTIQKYDSSSKILTLSTTDGPLQFVISASVHIRQDWRRVDAAALEELSGARAAVRWYNDSSGEKTIESVHVFTKSHRDQ
jgi:hypothetical protein